MHYVISLFSCFQSLTQSYRIHTVDRGRDGWMDGWMDGVLQYTITFWIHRHRYIDIDR